MKHFHILKKKHFLWVSQEKNHIPIAQAEFQFKLESIKVVKSL